MADLSKLTIDASRDNSPERFNQADHSLSQESESPTETDAVQPDTSNIPTATKESKKGLDNAGKASVDHIGENFGDGSPVATNESKEGLDDTSKANVDHVGENFGDGSPLAGFKFDFAHGSGTGAAAPSQPEESKNKANSSIPEETYPSLQLLEYAKEHMEGSAKEKKMQEGQKQTGKAHAAPNDVHASIGVQASVNEHAPVDGNTLVPPIAVKQDHHGRYEFRLSIPAYSSGPDQQPELKFRNPDVGLTVAEHAKVPAEFNYLPEYTLAKFWDLAYSPVVRKTILDYKLGLTFAGRVSMLEGPNKLLAMLAEIQRDEIWKGVDHVFDVGHIKIRGNQFSITVFPVGTAKPSGTDILWAAFDEICLSLANPSYKKTAACERLALSKGVKLDSQLKERLTDLFLGLSIDRLPTDTPVGRKLFLEKLALMESKAFGPGSKEESNTL